MDKIFSTITQNNNSYINTMLFSYCVETEDTLSPALCKSRMYSMSIRYRFHLSCFICTSLTLEYQKLYKYGYAIRHSHIVKPPSAVSSLLQLPLIGRTHLKNIIAYNSYKSIENLPFLYGINIYLNSFHGIVNEINDNKNYSWIIYNFIF